MLLIGLDDKSATPKYRQIMDEIRRRVETRSLRPGDKLPSTRRLADRLGLHRSTVSLAYQELWALGFVDLRPGACPRVRDRMEIASPRGRSAKGLIDWEAISSPAGNAIRQTYLRYYPETRRKTEPRAVNFASLDMDRRLFPQDSLRSCMNRVIKKQGAALLGYGDRAGYLPLREHIAERLQNHGISAISDEILITNGSQQAIDLVFRMIASPGKAVAIESPTYGHMLPLLNFYGLKPLEIPMRPDGMDLSILAGAIQKERPALVYTMPNFHNPTGVSTGQAHREQLLSLCETQRIPILEDGYDEEMKYFGRVVLPIKSMDKRRLVIYCGTFSKILFPGVRIGWVAAERGCIERLIAIRSFSELSPALILQAAVHEFCRRGFYDRHISKMHRVFRKRMQAAIRALRLRISPQWAEWTEPSGGYLIWLKLKSAVSPPADWQALFASHGVQATLGHLFYASKTAGMSLRLSISTLDEREIEEGFRRLAKALYPIYVRRHP